MKTGILRRLDVLATDGVERAELNGPPSAFRIWKAGLNVTDHGPTVFSERSARLLMAQQAERGNRFPIDIDHLSLNVDAPLESRRAVGWFDIEVRDGELWARDVQWTDTVRDGLTKDPPEWRYHSPAYDQDADTGEVTSLVNIAITNLPATHSVTALATRLSTNPGKESSMKLEDIKAAFEGADEEKKAAAWKAIAAAMSSSAGASDGEDEPEKKDGEEPDGDEPEKKKETKAAEDEPEKKDGEEEPEKKDATSAVVAAQDARIRKLEADNLAFRKERDDKERRELLAGREMSAALSKELATMAIADVRRLCAALPVKATQAKRSTEDLQATRGASQQDTRAARLPPEERKRLDERMGLLKRTDSIRWEGRARVYPSILTPQEKK